MNFGYWILIGWLGGWLSITAIVTWKWPPRDFEDRAMTAIACCLWPLVPLLMVLAIIAVPSLCVTGIKRLWNGFKESKDAKANK